MDKSEDRRVVRAGFSALEAYGRLSIAFTITERIRLPELVASKGMNLIAEPIPSRPKDYDVFIEERPTNLPNRFDVRNWELLLAYDRDKVCGGAIIARDTPDVDMLQKRRDLAILWDIRVDPAWRGKGVGRLLFLAAADWAREYGCRELMVETQDVNVEACRFYRAMGCSLASIDPEAYPPELDEVQLIWRTAL